MDFGTNNLNGVPGGMILTGNATGESQDITFNLAGGTSVTATISSTSSDGISVSSAVEQLNNQLTSYGISASVDSSTGMLELSGGTAFTALRWRLGRWQHRPGIGRRYRSRTTAL